MLYDVVIYYASQRLNKQTHSVDSQYTESSDADLGEMLAKVYNLSVMSKLCISSVYHSNYS